MRLKTILSICAVLCTTASAQVRARITRPIDDTRFVRVSGTTHSLATAANDVGRASGDLSMDRMLLQLQSTPEQEAALEQLLVEQQDTQSANFHAWLTPAEFGERFGVAQEDLDAITNWLEGHGFRVGEIAKGRRTIEFSGTARQVEEGFPYRDPSISGGGRAARGQCYGSGDSRRAGGGCRRRGVDARFPRAALAPRAGAACAAFESERRRLSPRPTCRAAATRFRRMISPPSTT